MHVESRNKFLRMALCSACCKLLGMNDNQMCTKVQTLEKSLSLPHCLKRHWNVKDLSHKESHCTFLGVPTAMVRLTAATTATTEQNALMVVEGWW